MHEIQVLCCTAHLVSFHLPRNCKALSVLGFPLPVPPPNTGEVYCTSVQSQCSPLATMVCSQNILSLYISKEMAACPIKILIMDGWKEDLTGNARLGTLCYLPSDSNKHGLWLHHVMANYYLVINEENSFKQRDWGIWRYMCIFFFFLRNVNRILITETVVIITINTRIFSVSSGYLNLLSNICQKKADTTGFTNTKQLWCLLHCLWNYILPEPTRERDRLVSHSPHKEPANFTFKGQTTCVAHFAGYMFSVSAT